MTTTTTEASRAGGGPGGRCICIKCGTPAVHEPGTPCKSTKCPYCGATMLREGSEHHRQFLARQATKLSR